MSETTLPPPRRVIPIRDASAKVQPRAVQGAYTRWRWSIVWLTQAVFFGLPWLTWNGEPAVLFDLEARRFHLFGAVLYLQDFVYLTGLMVVGALTLFLATAVAGRAWCGYACPQTVYTLMFRWIEHRVEGDRPQRLKLDREPMSLRKFRIRGTRHLLWMALALWMGITLVGWFSGIRPLVGDLAHGSAGPWELTAIGIYALFTYGNAGFMREQMCKTICPYARIQSALIDGNTLVVAYDAERGDPRGARPRTARSATTNLGDCLDCNACVQVCPTGIDIRNGLQNECIGCAACIDACDAVMDRMGYARGLVGYASENGLRARWTLRRSIREAIRPRVVAYASMLVAATVGIVVHFAMREPLSIDVTRDRTVLAREVEDGFVENVYSLHLENRSSARQRVRISVAGLKQAFVASEPTLTLPGGDSRRIAVRVRVPPDSGRPGANPIVFVADAVDGTDIRVRGDSTFFVPN